MSNKKLILWFVVLMLSAICFAQVSEPGSGVTPGSSCGDSTHALGWTGTAYACQAITGAAAAGGSTTQLQWNNAAALGGITQFTTNGTTTITGGATAALDMSAAGPTTGLKLPLAAGAAPIADGFAAVNSTTHLPVFGNNGATITLPTSQTNPGHNFLTTYTQTTGAFGQARPACADLSDVQALCNTTPAAGVATFLATPTSANLAAALTDETGTGAAVFGTAPSIAGGALSGTFTGTPTFSGAVAFSGTPTFANPVALGSSTASTQTNADNSTKIATTAYVASDACEPNSFASQTDAATVTWAIASAKCANASLTFTVHSGSRTLNLTGLVNGGSYVLWIKQDATGGEGLTLGTGCTWQVGQAAGGWVSGGTITPSASANAFNVLAFTYDGTNCWMNFK